MTPEIRRLSPIYTQTEAARYLGIPRSTLRDWCFGQDRQGRKVKPILSVPKNPASQLSFLNLVELHILNSIRKEHKIELSTVRRALDYLNKGKPKPEHPFLENDFATDGVDLFVERYGLLTNVSRGGQQAMLSVLRDSLERIERDGHKIPIKLYPYTRARSETSPRVISISPAVFSGRPVVDGTAIGTSVIRERIDAGDTVEFISKDFGIDVGVIVESLLLEEHRKAA